MAFKVKPFAEMVALTKEKLDEEMAPIRARSAKARADVALAALEERMVGLERQINESCASKDINFDSIVAMIDIYELTDRRRDQIKGLIADLFPAGR